MAEKAVNPQITVIDPMFFIPEGVTEVVHGETSVEGASNIIVSENDQGMFEASEDSSYEYGLPTPNIIGVVEQIYYRSDDGQNVVDIVIEIEDQDGVSNYDFKVAKV